MVHGTQRKHRNFATAGDLIVMTPIVQGQEKNVIRIERFQSDEPVHGDILHIAGGPHTGIVIRQCDPQLNDDCAHVDAKDFVHLNFRAFIRSAAVDVHKEESRDLKFYFFDEYDYDVRHHDAQSFFKAITLDFAKDYVSFIKRALKLLQAGYESVRRIDVDMHVVQHEVTDAPKVIKMSMFYWPPSLLKFINPDDNETEIESVTAAHLQDIFDTAYPSALSSKQIADILRCTEEEVITILYELQERNTIRYMQETNLWIRCDEDTSMQHNGAGERTSSPSSSDGAGMMTSTSSLLAHVPVKPTKSSGDKPTVAIITALFVEKLAVDAMIDDKRTLKRYKTDGESNVYTIGRIGAHTVVATKLSAIGHTRAALTAAGSITTRLLGNFQNVEHVLLVGCGGGVAHYTDGTRHIRLGDVVVGGGKAAYAFCEGLELDRHTERVRGFKVKTYTQRDAVIPKIAADIRDGNDPYWTQLGSKVEDNLNMIVGKSQDYTFSRPPDSSNLLTLDLGDGNVAQVPHPSREHAQPQLHIGGVGGGLSMLRSHGSLRDEYANKFGVLTFDADFDSVVESVQGNRIDSWAMVRGISDYADGMRNKQWQAYAALQAASVARAIIERLPPPE